MREALAFFDVEHDPGVVVEHGVIPVERARPGSAELPEQTEGGGEALLAVPALVVGIRELRERARNTI